MKIFPGDYEAGYKYLNGNYIVVQQQGILQKIALRANEKLVSKFPDSIDLKISNRCSNGCPFCHEKSTPDGTLLDVEKTMQILQQLPELPIEIAIGGGNILENYEELSEFISWLKKRGHRLRCTLKLEDHIKAQGDEKLSKFLNNFGGIGLSITSSLSEEHKKLLKSRFDYLGEYAGIGKQKRVSSIVLHVIAGITPVEDIKFLIEEVPFPVLILGYKQWGRASNTPIPDLKETEQVIKNTIYRSRFTKDFEKIHCRDWRDSEAKLVIAFDNLALDQLHIKEAVLEPEWESIYLGEEGEHSMYIDAVKGEYARNSCSPDRVSWDSVPLLEYFRSL